MKLDFNFWHRRSLSLFLRSDEEVLGCVSEWSPTENIKGKLTIEGAISRPAFLNAGGFFEVKCIYNGIHYGELRVKSDSIIEAWNIR